MRSDSGQDILRMEMACMSRMAGRRQINTKVLLLKCTKMPWLRWGGWGSLECEKSDQAKLWLCLIMKIRIFLFTSTHYWHLVAFCLTSNSELYLLKSPLWEVLPLIFCVCELSRVSKNLVSPVKVSCQTILF